MVSNKSFNFKNLIISVIDCKMNAFVSFDHFKVYITESENVNNS